MVLNEITAQPYLECLILRCLESFNSNINTNYLIILKNNPMGTINKSQDIVFVVI